MNIFSKFFKKLSSLMVWFNKLSLVKKILVIVIIAGLGWFVFARLSATNKSQASFQTAKVERSSIVSSVSASGTILNANNVSVDTQASGIVKQVFVKDGQLLKKGDKILELTLDEVGQQQNAQSWSSYLSAKNNVDAAQANAYGLQSDMFTKWKTFYDLSTNSTYQNSDGSPNYVNRALPEFHIAEDNWLGAEAKYKSQQNVIIQSQSALNNAWISYQLSSPIVTAPVDGVINNIVVVNGMAITGNKNSTSNAVQSQQLAVIQINQKPLASFNLSEVDVNKIKAGQKATITFDSISGKTFTGEVMTVDKIGAVSSGVTNYPVIIQLDVESNQIFPNMVATANIITGSKDNVLVVPAAAIQNSGDQNYARVLKNGKEEQVTVELGLSSDSQIEVTSGLKEGDTVITGTVSTGTTTQGTSPFSGGLGGNRSGGGAFRIGR